MARGATRNAAKKASAKGSSTVLRRWLSVFFSTVVISSVLFVSGVSVWKLASIPVGRVAVSGDLEHVSRPELMAVISEALEGGFLWADLDTVREPLEALPWVHRAVVRRRWPDSIEVQVIEQTVIARWGEHSFLNHAGEVFTPPGTRQVEDLPVLSGPADSHRDLMVEYRRIHEWLQPIGLQISGLYMNSRGGMEAELSDGARLVFGRGHLEEKLARLQAVLADRDSRGSLVNGRPARIDLRYSHGLAIAWQNDSNQDS